MMSLHSITNEKIKRQIDSYDSLPTFKSYRGIAFLWLLLSAFIALFLTSIDSGISQDNSYQYFRVYILILILLLYLCVLMGKIWAIILTIAFTTIDKAITIFSVSSGQIFGVTIWVITMVVLYRALKVELIRKNMSHEN